MKNQSKNPISRSTKSKIQDALNQIHNATTQLHKVEASHIEFKILKNYGLEIQTITDALNSIQYTLTDEHYGEHLEDSESIVHLLNEKMGNPLEALKNLSNIREEDQMGGEDQCA